MTKREYLKYLIRKEVDSLSEEEQEYFYNHITYDIIEEYIDEWITEHKTALLIQGITEERYIKQEIDFNEIFGK